ALSTNGALLARYSIPNAVGDFEDMAIGPGPKPGVQYIYLGDIGDNFLNRSQIHVLRFPEPAVYLQQTNNPVTANAEGLQYITLVYGPSYNSEAMMIDPLTGDLYIATKSDTGT